MTGQHALSRDCPVSLSIAGRILRFSACRLVAWSAIAVCALGLSGCSQLKEQLPPPLFGLSLLGDSSSDPSKVSPESIGDMTQFPNGSGADKRPNPQAVRDSLTVLIHPARGTKQRVQIGFQPGMTVTDLLNETGLIKRFTRMDLALKRRTNEPNRVIPLPVTYEHKKRAVAAATDYSLHPGDILVVSQSENTVVDDVFTNLAGPLLKRYQKTKE